MYIAERTWYRFGSFTHMMHGSWDTERDGQNFYFELFLHFYLPDNQKNQNFEKMETPWKYYILYMCTINKNHMMHGSWDIKHDW